MGVTPAYFFLSLSFLVCWAPDCWAWDCRSCAAAFFFWKLLTSSSNSFFLSSTFFFSSWCVRFRRSNFSWSWREKEEDKPGEGNGKSAGIGLPGSVRKKACAMMLHVLSIQKWSRGRWSWRSQAEMARTPLGALYAFETWTPWNYRGSLHIFSVNKKYIFIIESIKKKIKIIHAPNKKFTLVVRIVLYKMCNIHDLEGYKLTTGIHTHTHTNYSNNMLRHFWPLTNWIWNIITM